MFFALLILLGGITILLGYEAFLYYVDTSVLVIAALYLVIYQSRFIWSFKVLMGCSYRDAFKAYIAVNSLTTSIARAFINGLLTRTAFFNRTPKKADEKPSFLHAVRTEMALSLSALVVAALLLLQPVLTIHTWLVVFLLLWNGILVFGVTVLYAWWGKRSEEKKRVEATSSSEQTLSTPIV
jgi:hypothetical protein